jgi:hypothetical protein
MSQGLDPGLSGQNGGNAQTGPPWLAASQVLVRCCIALMAVMWAMHGAYLWQTEGTVPPLWMIFIIAGFGLPAIVEIAFPDHDVRSLAVWTATMMGASLLAMASTGEHIAGFIGILFLIVALAMTAFPIKPPGGGADDAR